MFANWRQDGPREVPQEKEGRGRNNCLFHKFGHFTLHKDSLPTHLVLTVVDEMCFFSISAQRQTSGLTACAEYPFARVCHAAEFRRKGRRSPSTATPRGRPPQTRNHHDPPHTTEGLPQAKQAAAYPIRCSFHLLPILVYRKGIRAVATLAAKDRM